MTNKILTVYRKCADSNCSGHAPDLLGCISVGDTLGEMRVMMREGLENHFQVMSVYGMSQPKPAATSIEFKNEDFEDVEYFVVEHLEVEMSAQHHKGEAISA
jgi:predicted RNase H-like HicB family nuclease